MKNSNKNDDEFISFIIIIFASILKKMDIK